MIPTLYHLVINTGSLQLDQAAEADLQAFRTCIDPSYVAEQSKMIKEEINTSLKPVFAHPIEESFTKILNFYGIEWKYEPRAFPLQWDDDKNVLEAFTPDFYLPQQDLYIELTTLRPKLNNLRTAGSVG